MSQQQLHTSRLCPCGAPGQGQQQPPPLLCCQAGQEECAWPCHRGGKLRSARNLNRCHLAGSEIALQLLAIAQAACPSIQCSSQIPHIPTALPFVILYTLLASLFKTSFKYYVKMVQITLWHWVQQAGDSLQLCHRALPAPALDGHIQLVTKTVLSHPLWLLDISLLLKPQEKRS